MHICGMDFSSLASYWQIKALLMLEPSVVTPQNQYFPANSERMSVHCLESGCIGKYTHLGPRDFPRAGILHPSALEIALGLRPRAISRASGCKIPALGKSLGPRGVYFPIHPSSRQCTDTISRGGWRQKSPELHEGDAWRTLGGGGDGSANCWRRLIGSWPASSRLTLQLVCNFAALEKLQPPWIPEL